MEFKKLEVDEGRGGLRKYLSSRLFKRTVTAIVAGALIGFMFYYFTEGKHLEEMIAGDIIKSLLIGGFFGFFITNSPCARGRC